MKQTPRELRSVGRGQPRPGRPTPLARNQAIKATAGGPNASAGTTRNHTLIAVTGTWTFTLSPARNVALSQRRKRPVGVKNPATRTKPAHAQAALSSWPNDQVEKPRGGMNDRPPSVTLAVYAQCVALLLGLAILVFGWDVPWVALATLVIVGGLILGVARGHNWARWTLLALTLVASDLTSPLLRVQLTFGVLVPVATIIQLALEAVGFVLLFRPAAGRWYGRR